MPIGSTAPWYRVKFDGVKCIDQVKWLWGNTGTPVVTWDCDESGCGTCTGYSSCDDGRFPMIARTERASTDGLPRPSGCVYGDTFELRNKEGRSLRVHEIVFLGKDVDPCSEEKGKLEEAEKKVASLETDLKEEKGKMQEATTRISGLEAELENEKGKSSGLEAELEEVKKEICPGKGIWTVPESLVGKTITKQMIHGWIKKGLKDNIIYLGSLKGAKITKDLATYVECFMTVN